MVSGVFKVKVTTLINPKLGLNDESELLQGINVHVVRFWGRNTVSGVFKTGLIFPLITH